jgi:hypothetical protein
MQKIATEVQKSRSKAYEDWQIGNLCAAQNIDNGEMAGGFPNPPRPIPISMRSPNSFYRTFNRKSCVQP